MTNLSVVLSREGTTTMCSPSTICVYNDLPSCQTSITLRTSNHKCTRRLKMVNSTIIKIFKRDNLLQKNRGKINLFFSASRSLVLQYLLLISRCLVLCQVQFLCVCCKFLVSYQQATDQNVV